ncbi:MAG: hypothetical protein ACR2HD_10650 [Solirubrobacteraceae bacterium]|nr:MAG: hypothetical protein DLM63_07050 [Solirubrobacterales bacterium]
MLVETVAAAACAQTEFVRYDLVGLSGSCKSFGREAARQDEPVRSVQLVHETRVGRVERILLEFHVVGRRPQTRQQEVQLGVAQVRAPQIGRPDEEGLARPGQRFDRCNHRLHVACRSGISQKPGAALAGDLKGNWTFRAKRVPRLAQQRLAKDDGRSHQRDQQGSRGGEQRPAGKRWPACWIESKEHGQGDGQERENSQRGKQDVNRFQQRSGKRQQSGGIEPNCQQRPALRISAAATLAPDPGGEERAQAERVDDQQLGSGAA